jgi:Pin2-interacting protein X1
VSVASLTASPTPSESSTPVPELTPSGDPARTAEETVSTSTLSVADYFRQKLREKALARHAASGATSELPETSLARVKEEVKVAVGGVTWEGSRVQFGEVDEKPDVKPTALELVGDIKPSLLELAAVGDVKPTSRELEAGEDVKPSKEERRAARAEKRRLKDEKRARKAALQTATAKSDQPSITTDTTNPTATKKSKRKPENEGEGRRVKKERTHD